MADEIKIGSSKTRGNGFVSEPAPDPKLDLKKKQKKSIQEAFNPKDPIGAAVRDLWKKVRGT
jgi:hypothetical protein